MKAREHQLLQFGLEKNEHQRCFHMFKYNADWYVDFWEVEELDGYEWSVLINDLTYKITKAKNKFYDDLREHPAYEFRAKENKKQILDLLNKYKSWYADETRCKMGRSPNYQRELELKNKIDILIELQNKLK
jgi:hypothetical protein